MQDHYRYTSNDLRFAVSRSSSPCSEFEILLKKKWEEAKKNGAFRYILDHMETKTLPGKYRFVAQLNLKRAQERRKPQTISSTSMHFNPDLFNFNKVKTSEIMFFIGSGETDSFEDHNCQKEENSEFPHCLIINVSPLEYCNTLLVPNIKDCLPQVLSEDGLKLAVDVVLLTHSYALRTGFNSLGGYASVNHFHFHVYYLFHNLYLETAKVSHLAGNCYEIVDYPAEGFVFQVVDGSYMQIIRSVIKLVHFLHEQCIAHNIFITRGVPFKIGNESNCFESYEAVRIYVWARKSSFGAKNDEAFNPALCELAGHLPVKSEEAFPILTEKHVARVLQDVCHETFMCVKEKVEEILLANGTS